MTNPVPANVLFPAALKILEGMVGEARYNDPQLITKILAVQGLPLTYPNGEYVPYCASGVAYAVCKAYCNLAHVAYTPDNCVDVFKGVLPIIKAHYYKPAPGVATIQEDAVARGIWLPASACKDEDIKPGWLICYDFGHGDHHVGMVAVDNGDVIHTCEANTATAAHSGIIAYKDRTWDGGIWGFVKTY